MVNITKEQLTDLQSKLETVISTELMEAEEFADELLKQVEPAIIAQVISSVTADQLVDLIDQGGGQDSVIVGRRGREFVNEVWAHAATKLQALASALPQA